jgi:hypothetical protein
MRQFRELQNHAIRFRVFLQTPEHVFRSLAKTLSCGRLVSTDMRKRLEKL